MHCSSNKRVLISLQHDVASLGGDVLVTNNIVDRLTVMAKALLIYLN